MKKLDPELKQLLGEDHMREAQMVHRVFIVFAVLYVSFGLIDWFYAPQHLALFISLRLIYCMVPIVGSLISRRLKTFRQLEILAMANALVAANLITFMIAVTDGIASPYYAGINLVGIIALSFFTFSRSGFWITAGLIYGPYASYCLITVKSAQIGLLIMNFSFMAGTVLTSTLIYFFKEYFRIETLSSRLNLKREIDGRDKIIKAKSEESVQLSLLSAQFSPQIVNSIRSGQISLDSSSQRELIYTIFIDIVNSTERVTTIDKEDVEKVITRFLDDSMRILLKYDITIDKFLGDGILAFGNSPVRRIDYASRVLHAALEIKEKISASQMFYRAHWGQPLQIRIGIAKGHANVGFFGAKKNFRSFTAIGPVVNLASRLCSSANADQILIDTDLHFEVQNEFQTAFAGTKQLKGFENQAIAVYEIITARQLHDFAGDMGDCPECGSLLSLETNEQHQYVLMCRQCSLTQSGQKAA